MRKHIYLTFFLLSFFFTLHINAYSISPEILETGLRVMVIETVDSEEPTCRPIEAPPGSWGVGITDVNKVPGSVTLVNSDGSIAYESGKYEKNESGMTIKVRGNTSAQAAKKPYKIKLEKKGDLLTRGDKNLNDKNWVLLTTAHNLLMLGFEYGKWIGMPWAPEYEYVNVIFNGEYRGVYLLAESVERNDKCRIRTEKTGFIAERDAYWWNENGEYLPSIWNPEFNWTMKYPDFEDLTAAEKDYVQSILNKFEEIIFTEDYTDLIDTDTFCRWLIAQDILGTLDGGGTNFYLAKYDDTPATKLFVPVLWDVDSAEEAIDRWSTVHAQGMIKPLFENSNPYFQKRYIELYWQLSPSVYEKSAELAAELRTDKWDGFNKAVKLNNAVWGNNALLTSYQNAADMEWWFPSRKIWLDNAVADLEKKFDPDGVEPIQSEKYITVYTLEGIKIYSGISEKFQIPEKGIYIINDGVSIRKICF